MRLKKVKVLLAAVLVLISALSINLIAFAAPEDTEEDFVIEVVPTEAPTEAPTQAPTEAPTQAPTEAPTEAPVYTPSYEEDYDYDYDEDYDEDYGYGFTITLELNNDEEPLEAEVSASGLVSVPAAPTKEGFKFEGWYADAEFTERWDFLTSKATEETVLYAKWISLEEASLYTITVSTNLGGVITVTPEKALPGDTVTINVKPDKGNQLVENSLSVNGKFIEGTTFKMPANNVIIEAQFESISDVDSNEKNQNKINSLGKVITIVAIAIVVIIVVIWLIANRYRFLPEDEEDELFFVEPMSDQPAIRHDDFIRNKRSQMERKQPQIQGQEQIKDDDALAINEDEIRKINKTGNINLNE